MSMMKNRFKSMKNYHSMPATGFATIIIYFIFWVNYHQPTYD